MVVQGRVLLAAMAVIALALLAGCGGGGSGTSGAGGSADFVAQGNQICREDNAKFKALGAPSGSDIRPFLDKLVPLLEEDLSRLNGLTPPSDRTSTYDAWIAELEQTVQLTKKAQSAPSSDAAVNLLQGNRALDKRADANAKELGLDQCLTGVGGGS